MSIVAEQPLAYGTPSASVAAVEKPSAACEGVVILTIGWTGSSVLTGLLHAGGFWTGPTVVKPDYDTYENRELVRLNRQLLDEAGIGERYAETIERDWPVRVERLFERVDLRPFRALVQRSRDSAPWVWKDPRLWVTIPFWACLLPESGVRYILLTREPLQAWISCNLRRQIQSYGYIKRYSDAVESTARRFLEASEARWVEVVYENLLLHPETQLDRLSAFCGRRLDILHLKSIYAGALHRRNRGPRDLLVAGLVYAKNYRERLR
jgi:hypothetical protein